MRTLEATNAARPQHGFDPRVVTHMGWPVAFFTPGHARWYAPHEFVDASRCVTDHRASMARLPFLIVEDGSVVAHDLRSMLPGFRPTKIAAGIDEGYIAVTAEPGWAGLAIELGAADKPGLDLLSYARESTAIPAIIVAGSLDSAAINRIARLRAAYLCAPLDQETLRPFVQRAGILEQGLDDAFGDEIDHEASMFALTSREAEILAAVVARRGHKEIAIYFGINPNTLKTAIRRMLKKFHTPNLEEVAMRVVARIRARKAGSPRPDAATARRLLDVTVREAEAALESRDRGTVREAEAALQSRDRGAE